jgi:general secretion pathway protein I
MTRQRGFSLLEVVLAFAILATAMTLLIGMQTGGVRQMRIAADSGRAAQHARSLLDQFGTLGPIDAGESRGELDDGRYRWTLRVTPAGDPLPGAMSPDDPASEPAADTTQPVRALPHLFRVELTIAWGEPAQEQSLRFATLRARIPAGEMNR